MNEKANGRLKFVYLLCVCMNVCQSLFLLQDILDKSVKNSTKISQSLLTHF